MPLRIDAHQHFWDPTTRDDYDWMQGLPRPARDKLLRAILPPELEPILARHAIAHTVLVQAAATLDEARFLLDLAEAHPFIAGVVTWMDMQANHFEDTLDEFSKHPRFVGIRPMIQDIPDPNWMLGRAVKRAFGVLQERGTCFDFLIKPPQLSATLQVLDEFPGLRAVVDHIAKPEIAARQLEPWASLMASVARHENVYCKLSGMITEADPEHWHPNDLTPFVSTVVDAFGSRRLLFGSDWPVCTLAGSYEQVITALGDANLQP